MMKNAFNFSKLLMRLDKEKKIEIKNYFSKTNEKQMREA